jgi:hypothetical protein
VILISLDQIVLIDRHKWNALRLLRFDLYELLNERDPDSLLAAATLLHREHTCPTMGVRCWMNWMKTAIAIPTASRKT